VSQAASQAHAFYRDVSTTKTVWTVRDEGGFPAPKVVSGRRAQPFWSSRSRAERIIKTVAAYSGFQPYEIGLEDFLAEWLPSLERDGFLVGVNWSGPKAVGYDLEPSRLAEVLMATASDDATTLAENSR
jgi:hypothetical protein